MPQDLFNRYLWLVDTLRSYGRLTREAIGDIWLRSHLSGGRPMPRRTFYNYRQAAQELFSIEIACDPATYEYYIADTSGGEVSEWLLNTAVTHDVLSHSRDVADKILVEDVPSAREFLAPVVEALRESSRIKFDYLPFYRIVKTEGILLEPYCVKLFRQRWYVIGRHVEQNRLKTYALDRISDLHLLPEHFTADGSFDAKSYFANSFGIMVDAGPVCNVVLRCDPRRAKYLRALPLHHTQQEYVHDRYSDFHYNLRISRDLVEQILTYGAHVEVVSPPELRRMVRDELAEALGNYSESD